MSVTITATISKSIPAESTYRVALSIINAVGIEMDVVVLKESDDSFSRVATVYDMETWPANKADATAGGLQYYRGRTIQRDFTTIRDATSFVTVSSNRLGILAAGWNSIVEAFATNDLLTVTE